MGNFDATNFAITALVIIFSITLHEFGHAIAADKLGDDTPRRQGRISLSPTAHLDPVGLVMILMTCYFGVGLGWGKPVQVDFRNFRNERRDDVIVTIAGPTMNLLLALVFGLFLRFMISSGYASGMHPLLFQVCWLFVTCNLSLMFFNLLPIFPLDGSHIMRRFLPPQQGEQFYAWMQQFGPMILLGLVFFGGGILSSILSPAIANTTKIILGA